MRLTGKMLRRLIAEELDRSLLERLIREAEGDEKADDKGGGDAADDLFGGGDEGGGDDAAADEGGDEAAPDEGGDDAAADEGGDDTAAEEGGDEGGEDEAAEKEEDKKEPVKPTGPAGSEFDGEINQAMADFEARALQVGAANEVDPVDAVKKEGRTPSLSYLLFEAEEEEVQFDVPTFADDVARLIFNYDTLIDMEQAIFTKAKDFLEQKYGKEAAEELEDILSRKHQLEFEQSDPEASEREVFAAQAGPAGGGAA